MEAINNVTAPSAQSDTSLAVQNAIAAINKMIESSDDAAVKSHLSEVVHNLSVAQCDIEATEASITDYQTRNAELAARIDNIDRESTSTRVRMARKEKKRAQKESDKMREQYRDIQEAWEQAVGDYDHTVQRLKHGMKTLSDKLRIAKAEGAQWKNALERIRALYRGEKDDRGEGVPDAELYRRAKEEMELDEMELEGLE